MIQRTLRLVSVIDFGRRLLHIVKRIIMRLSQFSSVSFRIKFMDNRNNASPEKSLGLIYAYASIYPLPDVLYSVGCLHFGLATLFQNSWMYTGTCANIAYFNCHIYQTNLLECDIKHIFCSNKISRFYAIHMISNAWLNIYRLYHFWIISPN